MKRELNIKLLIAIFLVLVGCGLLVAGFIVPPLGAIHNSLLVAFGEVATFAGSVLGVEYKYLYKLYKDKLEKTSSEK